MIRAVAFDLDDTLIDTSGLLVPQAAQSACEAMTDAGLDCSLAECLTWRAELAPNHSHRDIFRMVAERAGASDPARLGDVGSRVFYNPPLPERLELLPGAEEVLNDLATRMPIFLVTSGVGDTQRKKIRAAGLEDRFHRIFLIEKFKDESKETAFRRILSDLKISPSSLLSVGNRLREEIRHAKKVGARTCYFEHGEHLGETPEGPFDIPDHRIRSWREFRTECRL